MTMWIGGLVSLLFLSGGLVLSVASLRRSMLMSGIFTWFKSMLPPLSETEQQALEAGDTWHDADLFQGKPNWQKLLANPKPELTAEENAFLHN